MAVPAGPILSAIDSSPSTLLLVKPGSLGDVIHALPTAAALRAAFPAARLTWVVDPRWAAVLAGTGIADELLEFPRERFRGPAGKLSALRWFTALRSRRPDLAVDLQGLLRSALIARTAGSRHVLGLTDAREGARHFYHQAADTSGALHAVDRYLQILPALGLPIPEKKAFPLPATPASRLPPLPADYVLLHPHARGAGKSLTPTHVRALAQALPGVSILIVGVGPVLPDAPPNVTDLTNRTSLDELINLLRASRAVVSVDSGPMHLAAAIDVPLLAIHTWSDPRKVGPYSESAWIFQGGQIRPQSLASDAPLLPERPIDETQINAIAAWAKQQFTP